MLKNCRMWKTLGIARRCVCTVHIQLPHNGGGRIEPRDGDAEHHSRIDGMMRYVPLKRDLFMRVRSDSPSWTWVLGLPMSSQMYLYQNSLNTTKRTLPRYRPLMQFQTVDNHDWQLPSHIASSTQPAATHWDLKYSTVPAAVFFPVALPEPGCRFWWSVTHANCEFGVTAWLPSVKTGAVVITSLEGVASTRVLDPKTRWNKREDLVGDFIRW